MRMMLVCENEADRELVAHVFDAMKASKDNTPILGRVEYCEGKEVKAIIMDNPVVYAYADESYTVYNFHTGKKTENVEGDLAGLCNLPEEDFPNM